jgi:tungstate transport system substrate-binding protein
MRNTNIKFLMVALSCITILGLAMGCSNTESPTTGNVTPPANPEILLASTTSTRDSGLFDILIPKFEQETGYTVKGVYVGSGAAMALGAMGEADVLVVHSLPNEIPFMNDNNGVNRQFLMHTDFLICGPKSDPAGIKGMTSAVEAFKKMAAAKVTFYSRGDNSGTDTTDKSIWEQAGVTVADGSTSNPSWYIEGGAGTGMATLLGVASEKQAYVLTDRATFLNTKSTLDLDILVEGDPLLLNYYHVIQVNPAKFTKVNAEGAKAFSDWLLSKPTQDIIATYGADRFGLPLFFADAGKPDPQPITVTATTTPAMTVVNGATTKTYTLSDFKSLPVTVGSGATKNKAGTISGPDTYVGVSLTDLIKAVGGMKETQSVNVIATDDYTKTLTYAQIYQGTFNIMDKDGNPATATTQPVVVLVYSKKGVALDATTGPIEMAILTAEDQVSENSWWVKQVNKVEIITP